MKINCNINKDLLPLYIDDVLSADSKSAVEEHIAGCESCRKVYQDMRGDDIEPSKDELLSRIDEAEKLKGLKKELFAKRAKTGIAAILITALVAGALYYATVFRTHFVSYEDSGVFVNDNHAIATCTNYESSYFFESIDGSILFMYEKSNFIKDHSSMDTEQEILHIDYDIKHNTPGLKQIYYLSEEGYRYCREQCSEFDQNGMAWPKDTAACNELLDGIIQRSTLVWSIDTEAVDTSDVPSNSISKEAFDGSATAESNSGSSESNITVHHGSAHHN